MKREPLPKNTHNFGKRGYDSDNKEMKREPLPKNTHNPTLQHPHKNRHNTQTVSLKTLHPEIILQLARQFTQQNPPPTTRGRKPKYPEALLLTLALMMTAQQHSYRTLLYWAKVFFPDTPLPCLSTLWYRLEAIPETRWHAFLSWLASLGIARERALRSEGAAEAGVEGGVGGWGEQSPRRERWGCGRGGGSDGVGGWDRGGVCHAV